MVRETHELSVLKGMMATVFLQCEWMFKIFNKILLLILCKWGITTACNVMRTVYSHSTAHMNLLNCWSAHFYGFRSNTFCLNDLIAWMPVESLWNRMFEQDGAYRINKLWTTLFLINFSAGHKMFFFNIMMLGGNIHMKAIHDLFRD